MKDIIIESVPNGFIVLVHAASKLTIPVSCFWKYLAFGLRSQLAYPHSLILRVHEKLASKHQFYSTS